MLEDVIEINEDDHDLSFKELVEGVFRFPKGTMRFIFFNEIEKYISLCFGINLLLLFIAPFIYSTTPHYFATVESSIYAIVNQILRAFWNLGMHFMYVVILFLLLKLDKVNIKFKTLCKYFLYSLLIYTACLIGINILRIFLVDIFKIRIGSALLTIFTYCAAIWYLAVLYFGISNHVRSQGLLIFIFLASITATYFANKFILEYYYSFIGY